MGSSGGSDLVGYTENCEDPLRLGLVLVLVPVRVAGSGMVVFLRVVRPPSVQGRYVRLPWRRPLPVAWSGPRIGVLSLIPKVLRLSMGSRRGRWYARDKRLYSPLSITCATELQSRQRNGHSRIVWPGW